MLNIADEVESDHGGLDEYPAIVEEASWGFRFWIVTAVFLGIRDGFVVQNDNGDDRVIYEDEISFFAERASKYKYYA